MTFKVGRHAAVAFSDEAKLALDELSSQNKYQPWLLDGVFTQACTVAIIALLLAKVYDLTPESVMV
ncbi:hypothetical protein AQB9606_04652 [Aquabacterium sp. CECT 9606]|nr:hypothetical protein AQB9606_04652 [Aquabacterium sp. CECT 9606]